MINQVSNVFLLFYIYILDSQLLVSIVVIFLSFLISYQLLWILYQIRLYYQLVFHIIFGSLTVYEPEPSFKDIRRKGLPENKVDSDLIERQSSVQISNSRLCTVVQRNQREQCRLGIVVNQWRHLLIENRDHCCLVERVDNQWRVQ